MERVKKTEQERAAKIMSVKINFDQYVEGEEDCIGGFELDKLVDKFVDQHKATEYSLVSCYFSNIINETVSWNKFKPKDRAWLFLLSIVSWCFAKESISAMTKYLITKMTQWSI